MQRKQVTAINGYRAVPINSRDQWNETRAEWNGLLSQSSADTIFLTWEWLYSWGESYLDAGRSLFIIMVYKDDELVGIAPWYVQHLRRGALTMKEVRFLGAPDAGSDYLDVIIKKGQEQKVTKFLYEFLLTGARNQWDSLMLEDLPSNSLFLLHFLNEIEEAGKYAELRPGSFCPAVMLPEKGEDLFSLYSSHRRLQYRRHLKILKSKGDLNHSLHNGGDIGTALEDFCALYEAKNEKHDRTVRSFLAKYAERSREGKTIQIDLFTSNGALVGGLLSLKHGDTLSQYLMAVDKQHIPQISLGNLLVGMCLSNAIENSYAVYDFLKGPEPYKFHWADGGRSSVALIYYQKKAVPFMVAAGTFLKYAAKIILR